MGIVAKTKHLLNLLKFSYKFINQQYFKHLKEIEYNRINNFEKGYELKGGNHLHNSEIGFGTYVALNSIIYSTTIGKYCSIGPQVVIGYGDHPTNFLSTSPKLYFRDLFPECKKVDNAQYYNAHQRVTIGNDVWIGANCYIKNGINIGNGAIIGSGSVVTRDVPAYSIVVGLPGKVIRKRFSEDIIERLEALKWWDYDKGSLKEVESYLSNPLNNDVLSKIETILKK